MQMFILAWFVLEQTDSPWLVSFVAFCAWSPLLVFGIIGGALADRLNRKAILVFTITLCFVSSLTMVMLLNAELAKYWYAYPVIAVTGIGWALDMPARRAMILDMLGTDRMANGLALDSVGMALGYMIAPAIAGILIDFTDILGAYLVASIFYPSAFLLTFKIAELKYSKLVDRNTKILNDMLVGLKYTLGHRYILTLLTIQLLMNLLLFSYYPMVPMIARDVLNVGPGMTGVLQATAGMGAVVGTIFIAGSKNIGYHGRILISGSILSLFGLLIFALSGIYTISIIALFMLGLGHAGFTPMLFTIIMMLSDGDMRGKVLGISTIVIGLGPIGTLIVGGVANATNPSFAIGLNSCIGILSLVLIGTLIPEIRHKTSKNSD